MKITVPHHAEKQTGLASLRDLSVSELSPAERLEVARESIASVEPDQSPEWATAWKAELANRWAAYEAGSNPALGDVHTAGVDKLSGLRESHGDFDRLVEGQCALDRLSVVELEHNRRRACRIGLTSEHALSTR